MLFHTLSSKIIIFLLFFFKVNNSSYFIDFLKMGVSLSIIKAKHGGDSSGHKFHN